jgi:hypothetical protein
MLWNKPRLYFTSKEEGKDAIVLLVESRIPYIGLSLSPGEPGPFLEYGYWRFYGLQGIKEFVKRWEGQNLPALEIP